MYFPVSILTKLLKKAEIFRHFVVVILCSGGMMVVARVVQAHVVHLPRLRIDLLDNGTQLIEVYCLVLCTRRSVC